MPLLTTPKITKSLSFLPDCVNCGSVANCHHPKQINPRKKADIVIVVDGPSEDSADALIRGPFKALHSLCERIGTSLASYALVPAEACYNANEGAWKHCQPLMASELARLSPTVVIPFGAKATQSVVGRYWQNSAELYDRWYGYQIPCQQLNAWICPVGTVSPQKGQIEISQMWAYRWFRDATRIKNRPWDHGVPDIAKTVKLLTDPQKIEAFLKYAATLDITACDFETTGLKPEWPNHKIWSMSIAFVRDGKLYSFAFPVYSNNHDAIRAYLTSPGKKIAANMKFEDRWARMKLGTNVNNWYWDTMQAAHIENPARGVAGLKFQAFARLGVPFFASDVEKFFESEDNRNLNNIASAPLTALLTYNAIDSAVEFVLASLQMVENGLIQQHFAPQEYLPCSKN